MTTETEELLWIATQERKLFPRDIVLFGIEHKKTLFDLLTIDPKELTNINEDVISTFLKNRENISIDMNHLIYEKMQKEKIGTITYCDSIFPKFFKNKNEKTHPILLFYQGKKNPFTNCVAVVGTRNCSTHAIEIARNLGRELAKLGYIVVGGLARGIDAAAHRGAISVNGKTISVLPWIYEPYPPEHERLLTEIKKNGTVLSEHFFKVGTNNKYSFIERNRIISGISDVVIAVESAYSGGTRWQVEMAITQGKTVIAMEPEKENTIAYEGFIKFKQKGAIPASTIEEAVTIIKQASKIKQPTLIDYESEDEVKLHPIKTT